jgi:hypothetical protein
MAETAYTYSIANDFPDGAVNASNLDTEIRTSSIVTALARIVVNPAGDDPDRIDIVFKDSLSAQDKTTLDGDTTDPAGGLIAQNDNSPSNPITSVKLDMGTLEDPTKDIQRVVVQPGRTGYYMNYRDFKINTGVLTDTFEDLRINCANDQREPWGEMSFVGCYSGNETDGYTAISDPANLGDAVLSIWDYCANDQEASPSPVDIDVMGGAFWANDALTGTGAELWEHQIYVCIAPNLPKANGGQVPFFDSYLYPHQGKWLSCVNSLAIKLDPSASPEAARVRTWVFYPAGAQLSHVIAFRMFRNKW